MGIYKGWDPVDYASCYRRRFTSHSSLGGGFVMTPIDEAFGLLIFKARVSSKRTKRLEEIGRALREAIDAEQSKWEGKPDYQPTASLHEDLVGDDEPDKTRFPNQPLTNATLQAYKKIIDAELDSRKDTHPPGFSSLGDHAKRMQEVDLNTLRRHGADTTAFENKRPNVRVMDINKPGHGDSKFKTLPEPKGGRVRRKRREEDEYGRGQDLREGQKFYNPGDDALSPHTRRNILDESLTEEHGTIPPLNREPRGALQPRKVSGPSNYIYSREKQETTPATSARQPQSEQPMQVEREPRAKGAIGVKREQHQMPGDWPWVPLKD